MIVSAIEASNKELIRTIKQENEETRATICKENRETREALRKIAEEFQETLAEKKKNKGCESPILEKIHECTSQIVSLFTYRTKPQQHLYKTDTEVLNAKRNMNSFWDQKLKARKAVSFKQYRNTRLNEIFSEELQNEKPKFPRKFLPVIKDCESEEEKQIKLELAKEKVKAQLKLQDIYKKRQLETIKNIDTEITNYVAEHHSKELTEKLLKHWEQECTSTKARAKDEFEKKVEWFKENWMVEKTHKPQNLLHERKNEYKMKERRNPWKEQPKRKLNEKETSSEELKSQQEQRSTNDIESAPSDDTLVETLDAISNNNFDKDLENSVITNSSTTDQQPDHFLSENPSH